jgi:hypothetical protein
MKVLFVLLVLSIGAIVVAVSATVWRLRWHLRRPSHSLQHVVTEVQPGQEPVEKA